MQAISGFALGGVRVILMTQATKLDHFNLLYVYLYRHLLINLMYRSCIRDMFIYLTASIKVSPRKEGDLPRESCAERLWVRFQDLQTSCDDEYSHIPWHPSAIELSHEMVKNLFYHVPFDSKKWSHLTSICRLNSQQAYIKLVGLYVVQSCDGISKWVQVLNFAN